MNGLRLLQALVARSGPTDEQLMWRVQNQEDHGAFTELMQRWYPRIRSLCTRMTGDLAFADDLTLVAFERIFARRGDYRPTARFSTYLWRVALNLCHDELRRRRVRGDWRAPEDGTPAASDDGHPDAASDATAGRSAEPPPDAAAVTADESAIVRTALQRLAEPLRTVVVLRHYEGLKLREIAEVLAVPEGTVNSRLAEALSRLARELTPQLRLDRPLPATSTHRGPNVSAHEPS